MEMLLMHVARLLPDAAAGVSAALCAAIWQGAVLAAGVALCMRALPALSASARSAIWMNVFALLVFLHLLPAFPGNGAVAAHSVHLAAQAAIPFHASLVHLNPRWSLAIAGVWMLLSVWRGTQLVVSATGLRRLARRAAPVDTGADVQALLEGRGQDGKRGRAAQLCTSAEVERPSMFGFFRPRVLIPEELMERLTAEELRHVVMHEMEHVRRGDDWSNLAQKVALALFPLNPALLWVERQLCAERELACDDRVLHSSAKRKAYALCLARIAEFSMLQRGVSLALGAWERRPELVRRVHRILLKPAETRGGKTALFAPAALMAGALGCALVLARSPQLVSFAPQVHAALAPSSLPQPGVRAASLRAQNLREQDGARVTLAKAILPQRQPEPRMETARGIEAETGGKPLRPPVLLRTAVATQTLRRGSDPREQEWLTVAEIQRAETLRQAEALQRLILAVESDRPTYAAVPMGNGWLIIQI
jgi:beta-lactamase regulating signal transducer with metallopeptidase domain